MKSIITRAPFTIVYCTLLFTVHHITPMAPEQGGRVAQLKAAAANFFQALHQAPHCITHSKVCSPEDKKILIWTAKRFLILLGAIIAGLAVKRTKTWWWDEAKQKVAEKPLPTESSSASTQPTAPELYRLFPPKSHQTQRPTLEEMMREREGASQSKSTRPRARTW